ncbi:MAG: histidine kinase [Bacteroidota bacterium]
MSTKRPSPFTRIVPRLLLLSMVGAALFPLGRMWQEWAAFSETVGFLDDMALERSYDWVVWDDVDGLIRARYVFSNSPAAQAGIREGDVFFYLNYESFLRAGDLRGVIERTTPGTVLSYQLTRDDETLFFEVPTTRYPTFLYPLSGVLWQASIIGFSLGALLHVIGLVLVFPLARSSMAGRVSFALIGVSAVWVVVNLARLVAIQLLGPPVSGTVYPLIFEGLTLIGLVGWILFPGLLLLGTVVLARPVVGLSWLRWLAVVPMLVLTVLVFGSMDGQPFGPFTLDRLVAPLLFYAAVYIAATAGMVTYVLLGFPNRAQDHLEGWRFAGTITTLSVSLMVALLVLDLVPLAGAFSETTTGWLVLGAQLLTLFPVLQVSLATIRFGKVEYVLARTIRFVMLAGVFFIVFLAFGALLRPLLAQGERTFVIALAIVAVALFGLFEQVAKRLPRWAQGWPFGQAQDPVPATDFQSTIRTQQDLSTLLDASLNMLVEGFRANSAYLFVSPPDSPHWSTYAVQPSPPYLATSMADRVAQFFDHAGQRWSRNEEISTVELPQDVANDLRDAHIALIMPIASSQELEGLLLLGTRATKHGIYNLGDVDLLTALTGQLGLAIERMRLLDREKALLRKSAEAHLVALRSQINPHFLFNALNTILGYIQAKPESAEAVVEHLSAIFRHTLQTGSDAFVPLRQEVALVNHYLAIEQARFGDALQCHIAIAPEAQGLPIPAFVLQTLVENAIKHGLEPQQGRGMLDITISIEERGLRLVIRDTGMGIPSLFGQGPHRIQDVTFLGIGLQNVRARLEQLYGAEHDVVFESAPGQGTTVRLLMPIHRASPPPVPYHEPTLA